MAAYVHTLFSLFLLTGAVLCIRPLFDPPPVQKDDFVLLDFRHVPWRFTRSCYRAVTHTTNRSYNACLAVLPTQILTNFSIELPRGGCGNLSNTSSTASYHSCTYATNAGYFDTKTAACVGNLITNGKVQQLTGGNRVNFGVVNDSFVIGYLSNDTLKDNKKLNFTQLIGGAGWLVRSGASNINDSIVAENLNDHFVMEKAPRTGICAAKNGSLIVLQVDGVELLDKGVDLYEFSDILTSIGCWQAVNLDGGGSSTSTYRGKVVNKPTCSDTPIVCERRVSSITCIKA